MVVDCFSQTGADGFEHNDRGRSSHDFYGLALRITYSREEVFWAKALMITALSARGRRPEQTRVHRRPRWTSTNSALPQILDWIRQRIRMTTSLKS